MTILVNEWKGDATESPEVIVIEVREVVEGAIYAPFDDIAKVRYRATAEDTTASIALELADLLRTLSDWTVLHTEGQSVITLTGKTSGIPTGRTPAKNGVPSSRVKRIQAGRLPVSQIVEFTIPETTTGGTWSATFDFGNGNETASGLSATITPEGLKSAIEGLTTPESGDITVVLSETEPERKYQVTIGGSLAGTNYTVSASGAGLTGNVTYFCELVQSAKQEVEEVQYISGVNLTVPFDVEMGGERAGVTTLSAAAIKAALQSLPRNAGAGCDVILHQQDIGDDSYDSILISLHGGSISGAEQPLISLKASRQVFDIVVNNTLADADFQLVFDFPGSSESVLVKHSNSSPVTAETLKTQIEAKNRPKTGDITVAKTASSPHTYRVTMGGTLTGQHTPVSAYLVDDDDSGSVTVTTIVTGTAGQTHDVQQLQDASGTTRNEFQLIANGSVDSVTSYRLAYDGELTDPITVVGDNLLSELEGLTGIDDVTIYNHGFDVNSQIAVVEFSGDDENTDVPLLRLYREANPAPLITSISNADSPTPDIQVAWFNWENQFTFEFDGQVTGTLNTDENVMTIAQIKSAIEALSTVGSGNVEVYKISDDSANGPVALVFKLQGSLAGSAQPDIVVELAAGVIANSTVSTEKIQAGNATSRDIQAVAWKSSGNYATQESNQMRFRFGGQISATIDGDDPSTWQAALVAMSSIGTGNATVHEAPNATANYALVEFGLSGNQAALEVLHGKYYDATLIKNGEPLRNEIWAIGSNAQGGTLVISNDGEDTSSLSYASTASQIDTAVEGLTAIGSGNASVTGSGTLEDPWRIESIGDNAKTDITDFSVNGSNLTGGIVVSAFTIQNSLAGRNELQQISVDRNATGGTIIAGFDGAFTSGIAHNASASTWDSSLEGLATIGSSNVVVVGTPASLFVEFDNDLGNRPLPLISLDQDALIVPVSAAMSIDVTANATGPEHWNQPLNWTLEHVPNSNEKVNLGNGRRNIRYGIRQRGYYELPDSSVTTITVSTGDFVDGQIVKLVSDNPPTVSGVDWETNPDLYIKSIQIAADGSESTLSLALTADGAPITFTSESTGYIEVQLESLTLQSRYFGEIGWPRRRTDDTWEYLPRYLEIGFKTSATPNLVVGLGDGAGSSRVQIDAGTSDLNARILNTGGGVDTPALLLLADNLSNAKIELIEGEVGLGLEPTEEVSIKEIACYGGRCVLGNVHYKSLKDYRNVVEFINMDHGTNSVDASL